MNFLDLCKKTSLKADLSSGVTTTVNQTGILAKIVDWVIDAYDEIQSSEEWWTFKAARATATMTVGVDNYVSATFLPADFDFMWEDTIYYEIIGAFSGQIKVIKWKDFVETYLYVETQTARPAFIAFDPTGQVYFNTKPDQNYVINFDYQRKQQHFTQNSDIPILPEDFHDIIWRLALIKYGEHYGAQEVYAPAQDYFEDRMQLMRSRYLPKLKFSENSYYGNSAT